MNTLAATPHKPRRLTSLWVLLILFALPPVAAWLFYLNPQWLPAGTTNHGTLTDPPRPLGDLPLHTPDGSPFDWRPLEGLWTLALISEGGCDAACIDALIEMRQIRRATGANRQRIERLLILLPDIGGNLEPPDLAGLEGTRLAVADPARRGVLLDRFATDPSARPLPLFFIDPRGDLMMTQERDRVTAKQILQDLERLLKASQSWVKGGQYGHQ